MEPYTQANKKTEIAKKMGLRMTGTGSSRGGGMNYTGHGAPSDDGRGMTVDMQGRGGKTGRGQKPTLANTKANFSNRFYSQTGKN